MRDVPDDPRSRKIPSFAIPVTSPAAEMETAPAPLDTTCIPVALPETAPALTVTAPSPVTLA